MRSKLKLQRLILVGVEECLLVWGRREHVVDLGVALRMGMKIGLVEIGSARTGARREFSGRAGGHDHLLVLGWGGRRGHGSVRFVGRKKVWRASRVQSLSATTSLLKPQLELILER